MAIKSHLVFQYVPLPIFMAEDKLSFYKVMSDTQGYKHIHYIKDVSMFHLYIFKMYCSVAVVVSLVLSVWFTRFFEGQSNTYYLWEVGSHLHIQINKQCHVSDVVKHF